jgi:diguanylate cyclase (GGDEF)-like protein/PAS domain S-box-containing protein
MVAGARRHVRTALIAAMTALGLLVPVFLEHPAGWLPLVAAVFLCVTDTRPAAAFGIAAAGTVFLFALAFQDFSAATPRLPAASVLVLASTWVLATLSLRFRVGDTEWWLSGRQFQQAFDRSPSGMALVSPDLRVLYANETLVRMTRRSRDELTNLALQALVDPADWPTVRADRERLHAGHTKTTRGEFRLKRDDGSVFRVELSASAVEDGRGRVGFTIDQIVDLTPVREAEAALKASEARFRGITEHTATITFVIDEEDRFGYLNPPLRRLLGRETDELLGADPQLLVHPDDRDLLREVLERSRRERGLTLTLPHLRLARGPEDFVFLEARVTALPETPGIRGVVFSCQEITGQVQAERALRRSETRFSTLFQASRDAILIARAADATILDFNDAFTQLTGWGRDDGIGAPVRRIVRLADGSDVERFFDTLEADSEVVDFETVVVTRDGRLAETSISGRYGEIDGELCVVAVLHDISLRRRTEAALRESEDKFRRVFHRSPDAMSITRLSDGVILDVNDHLVELFGYPRSRIVGRSVWEFQPEMPRRMLQAHRSMMRLGGDGAGYANVEMALESAHGSIPTLVSSTIVDIHGEPCSITLIKDMRALKQAQDRVEESEARFRGAFENAPIGMMLVDPDGRITQVNRLVCELLGYEADELVGSSAEALVPAEDRTEYVRVRDQLLAGDEPEASTETRYLRRDGSVVWTNRHVVIQRSPEGRPLYLILQLADITEMKRNRARMEKLAFYDTLTDLANRRLFSDRLEQAVKHAVRTSRPTALLYLDLDHFKRVNDTLGHEAGDELLQVVARRLRGCVRGEDTVGRPGGDEFTVLLNEVRDSRAAGQVARNIIEALQAPIQLGTHSIRVTTSIGITLAPEDGTDPTTLMKNADLAMYRAKEVGRDNYQFFAEELNTRAMERLLLENELRTALAEEQFELYFQPQVRLESQEVIGLEALVRWNHPGRGMLPPEAFIQVAEESGLILELGAWTLREACRRARSLQELGIPPLPVAVNLSARQFADASLPGQVRDALATSGLDPHCLELEITETMLMKDMEETIAALGALQAQGVILSIDDFGTGYSSLNYLKRLPIHKVKVDRSFVSDIPTSVDDMAITAAVVAMAHKLNLEVVAEGVETPEQLFFLNEHRCEYGQGFLFGPPLPWGAMLRLLRGATEEADAPAPAAAADAFAGP